MPTNTTADRIDTIDDLAYLYLDLLAAQDAWTRAASLGGWVAAEMAVKCTERLAALVLVAPPGIKVGDRETRDIPDVMLRTTENGVCVVSPLLRPPGS